MTSNQEDALYDFLDAAVTPFSIGDLAAYMRIIDPKWAQRLPAEAAAFLESRRLAFRTAGGEWVSRRAFFENLPFVIRPTRLELLNGIFIPGHRCLPFVNPELLPQEYTFLWKGKPLPLTDTQGDPEEFYPYYSIFGEEYAPQYVARDNPENEEAFNSDPYEDPPEVSVRTIDMGNIYWETSFEPGDRFLARAVDWGKGVFSLERVGKNEWNEEDLRSWLEAAEAAFEESFRLLGPGSTTEEQIAFAYWYGGKRVRETPAYALEEFLYEKTERVETAAFGIETRFWYAGREIPDPKNIDKSRARPDRTEIEELLWQKNIPISEYVIQSYIRDFLYRKEETLSALVERIVPPCVALSVPEKRRLEQYAADALREFGKTYSPFTGRSMDPVRQRVGELHTVVIELAARLGRGEIDPSWLPKHTFIILSQIQLHASSIMEDLDIDEAPPEAELEAIDNSIDSMIETYEDLRRQIDEALESFRRNKLLLVRPGGGENVERLVQFSLGGTDVWRRVLVGESCRLEELHLIIQTVFNWKNTHPHRFNEEMPGPNPSIKELCDGGIIELNYEYDAKWTVRIMFLSRYETDEEKKARCVAGEGASPPESSGGPLKFRRSVSALEWGNSDERGGAEKELGIGFNPESFDLEACNRILQKTNFKDMQ